MIICSDIAIGYKTKIIASSDEEITFAKGQLHAIIAPNGAGKSTLLRSILLEKHLLKGKVKLNNREINQLPPPHRAKQIAALFTDRSYSKHILVEEVMQIAKAPYTGWDGQLSTQQKQNIDELCKRFDIDHLRSRPLSTLSDGQQQLVMIARTIAQETPYILMDEPLSHLDIDHKAEVIDKLKSIAVNENKAIIIASHHLSFILPIADQFIAIHKSKIKAYSSSTFFKSKSLEAMFPSNKLRFENQAMKVLFK